MGSTYLHVYKPRCQYAPLAVHDLLRPPALPKEQPRLDHHAIAHPEVFAIVEGTVAQEATVGESHRLCPFAWPAALRPCASWRRVSRRPSSEAWVHAKSRKRRTRGRFVTAACHVALISRVPLRHEAAR